MITRGQFVLRFAFSGFMIAAALGIYAFYLSSHHQVGNAVLFILLCPPSISSVALDNAGVIGGIIGWFFIAGCNAVIYAGIGFLLGGGVSDSK
jgi:hypothetical protein